MITANGLYSFERIDGSGWDGRVRVSGDGNRFERIGDGEWVNDQDLFWHFIEPGTTFLEPVDDSTAKRLAERYGVTLLAQEGGGGVSSG